MENVVQTTFQYIPPAAIPFVVIALGCCYLYLWFRCKQNSVQMSKDKEETKNCIDKESQDLRDLCKENALEIKHLKEELSQKNEILDTLRSQVNELNVNLAIVSERIVTLVDVIKELKK
jgi:uncharacterized protein HemX